MILLAAGAIFLCLEAVYKGECDDFARRRRENFGFRGQYKGKYLEFGPPQARKFLSDFLADRPNILFIPPSVSKSGGARGG